MKKIIVLILTLFVTVFSEARPTSFTAIEMGEYLNILAKKVTKIDGKLIPDRDTGYFKVSAYPKDDNVIELGVRIVDEVTSDSHFYVTISKKLNLDYYEVVPKLLEELKTLLKENFNLSNVDNAITAEYNGLANKAEVTFETKLYKNAAINDNVFTAKNLESGLEKFIANFKKNEESR